jgi:hypothetical protein
LVVFDIFHGKMAKDERGILAQRRSDAEEKIFLSGSAGKAGGEGACTRSPFARIFCTITPEVVLRNIQANRAH